MNYIWEALAILFTGFCLFRIAGKKTVAEMTALETITILAMASTIGHAISENDLVKTIFALCALVTLLMFIQFLAIKFNIIEKLFIGKPTTVIQDGIIITNNLKKLRMTSEQLEAMIRQKGISSVTDVKTASVEITGQLGYELIKNAKPVTHGELEKMLNQLQSNILQQISGHDQPIQNDKKIND